MTYKYITDNNLFCKQNYMYSEYREMEFLKEYLCSRYSYLDKQKLRRNRSLYSEEVVCTSIVVRELKQIRDQIREGHCDEHTLDKVKQYTKSFEVRKRIYEEYDDYWKPVNGAQFENGEAYILFAECLISTYQHTNCLKYFSCLLKVDDTLLSIQEQLQERLQERLSHILTEELQIFNQVASDSGVYVELGREHK